MSDESLIEQSVQRLFAEQVDKASRERVEEGAFDDRLWQLAVDNGFTLALASEASGGVGETWSGAAPILHAIGFHQVPLPLAETLVGAQLLSLAGIELPEGPIALVEQGCGNTLRSSGTGAALRIDGTAHHVAWARHAPHALVSLNDRRLALVSLRQCGRPLRPAARPRAPAVRHGGVRQRTLRRTGGEPAGVAATGVDARGAGTRADDRGRPRIGAGAIGALRDRARAVRQTDRQEPGDPATACTDGG